MKRKPRTHLARKAATLNMTLKTAAKPADTGHTSGPLETLETAATVSSASDITRASTPTVVNNKRKTSLSSSRSRGIPSGTPNTTKMNLDASLTVATAPPSSLSSDMSNASSTDSRLVSASVSGPTSSAQLPALIASLLDESESGGVDREEVICESERKRKRDVLLAANGNVNVCQEDEEGEFEIMISDGPSKDESSDFEDSKLASLNFTADWSDDAVAAFMADASRDINDFHHATG
ncbi:hypothetical protein L917_11423 [Phytophthora nicotianae]|uniref:Uncharacterized protein n=1 Tax=Phytophthora nicotianae TaxID=4792 RepID=W2KZB7_PHYNI|nr:hypothetical protein L917_11423 [Phytophthora nicotianae]